MAAVASRGLCQAQTAAAAVPEPQNRYFTRFSRSPPASSGCPQLIRHKSACGRSGDQGSKGEPPRSLGGLYASVGAPPRSHRGSTTILGLAAPTCPLHDILPISRRFYGPTRCEPVPRGRRARVSAHIAEGAYVFRFLMPPSVCTRTLQGSAGGSGIPTSMCR